MKFLCVPCDAPMRLEGRGGAGGAVSLTYACPECGYEFAMLTNPMETQLVASLGVTIGNPGAEGATKCPFTGTVRELTREAAADGPDWTPEAERRLAALPEFVRPMIKSGIEAFARERGHARIDERVLDEARGAFGIES
jgi:hypothetical protein